MIRILFFLLFLIVFLSPNTYTLYPAYAHTEIVTIKMTPSGFEPDTISIDQGSTVIFVNQDKVSRWPASNVHPTHDLYPDFDPKKGIEPNKSWAFKAQKDGVWKFHDHLYPHMRGTITVLKEANLIVDKTEQKSSWLGNLLADIYSRIKGLFDKKSEVLAVDKFVSLTPEKQTEELKKMADSDVSKLWPFLQTAFKGQAGSSGNIHDLAHLVGILTFEKKGFEGIKLCSVDFAFGCYHGFLDRAFKDDLSKLNDAHKACLQLGVSNTVTGPAASCIHGIGHGVASFYQTKDLKGALKTCQGLPSGNEYCFDGVFMEFVRSAPEDAFNRQDPLYPCNALEEEFGEIYSFSCGRNQVNVLSGRFGMSTKEVIKVCLDSTSTPFKHACFDSLGFTFAQSQNVETIIGNCQQIGEDEYEGRCLRAAAGELIFQDAPDWKQKAPVICSATASVWQVSCFEHIDNIIREYGKDSNAFLRQQLMECYQDGGKDDCYKKAAQVIFDKFGLKQSLALLKDNENYQEVYARCHVVTHYLSRLEYQKQKSVPKTYSQCDATCHGGCYHGTLESFLQEKNLDFAGNLENEFKTVCGNEKDYQKPLEFYECLHGLGHAAMFVKDMELKDSLKLCDLLVEQGHKDRCFSGVFMENSSSSTSVDHPGRYVKADDPYFPCNSLEEKYQKLCWQYQSSYFSIISKQDWNKVASLCLGIPQKYQDVCFRTIGTNQVGFTQDLEVMKKDCDLMPENFVDICVLGVVSSLTYRFVGETQRMIDFCNIVNQQNKPICYRQIGAGVSEWDKDKSLAKVECNKIPDSEGRNWCLEVI